MKTYYTKCGRQFKKSSTAEVTGYHIDLREDETISEVYQILKKGMLDNLQTCVKCPFRVKVTKGWPPQFDRWECRAGSEPPNHKTEWAGSLDDKNTIRIHSLDHSFMEEIRQFCVDHPELGASYLADNMADCRRTLSISCSANKKGIAAKKELIKKFFPDKERTPVKAVGKAMGIENYKRGILSGLEKMKNNNIEERAVSGNTVLDIVDSKEIQPFNYSTVDEGTACFLQDKANRIIEIRIKSVMALGKEFKEAQERLASHDKNKGTFQAWVKSLGFDPKTAYNYINGFMYVMENFHNIEDAEKMQPSLLFAISKPSAPKELQEAAISGDITTHKQYKELEEKLKAAQKEALEAKAKAETERNAWQRINESYNRLEKKNHEHYEKARELEKELKAAKEKMLEAQASGDSEGVEMLKQLLQDTEDELEESKKKIEELEAGLDDSDNNNEIVAAVVDRVPDEVLEELAELRSRSSSIEICAELKTLLKVLNSDILNLGRLLSTIKEDTNITMKCISHIEQIKENMLLLKKISFENLKTDLFDFIKD